MNGALHRIGFDNRATCLVSEQIDRVRSMMPKQMVGPATGLAERIHIGAAKEIRLHIHLLDVEFPGFDLVVHILMAGVKTTRVPTHGDQAFFFGQRHYGIRIFPAVCQRNFHLHMFACFQASDALGCVHLCGRTQNDGIDFWQGQTVF